MRHTIRGTTAVAILAFVLTGAGAASALPYPGPYIPAPHVPVEQYSRPLERIGTQLVRRDDLTGAGVRAPSFIRVQGSR